MCDQVSDLILDEYLKGDPFTKAGIETMIKDNIVVVGGEVTSSHTINIEPLIKKFFEDLNFSSEHRLQPDNIKIINLIGKQSTEINKGVFHEDGEIAAGDQGMVFGFASNETSDYLPVGVYMARKLLNYIISLDGFGPDAKSQITMEYNESGYRIDTILVSTMFSRNQDISETITSIENIIKTNQVGFSDNIMNLIDHDTKIIVNPAGSWHVGGPVSDCGLTGRKIVVDQYGSYCPVGGGCYSGKDSSKIDRSGSYLARYIAKNIVAAEILDQCTVEISYAIGMVEPISLRVEGYKHGIFMLLSEDHLDKIRDIFHMGVGDIINYFDLRQPIFSKLSKWGHYGDPEYRWEKLDKVDILKDLLS